jgi:hypothetical protein
VARDRFTPGAIRTPMTDPAHVKIGGFEHACNECHKLFESPPVERRRLTQHANIILRHGMNDRCFNCHDRKNREKLVMHDGTLIGFDDVPHLCSQCHGTVFRDWQRGTHGKTLGSWDAASGKQRRLKCNECHDPHAPAYRLFTPLPGPDTLRMGEQHLEGEHGGRHRPLRRWSEPTSAAPEHDGGGELAPLAERETKR